MDHPTIIPSHTIASWLLGVIDKFLDIFGFEHHGALEQAIYLCIIVVVGFALGWIVKKAIVALLRRIVEMKKGASTKDLLQSHLISKCCSIIPPLVILSLLPFAFDNNHHLYTILMRLAGLYALVAFAIGCSSVMNFVFSQYNKRQNTRGLPIKGVLNIAKGILWIIIVIIAVSMLVDKSPATLLAGLGVFASALMLVFKDSILGFVAGIQMSQNDMIHVGDWIVVPSTPANGIVLDMTLSTVKVQNFDNTIVTIPPYTLISGSFQNYRGMVQSGARRIMQELIIDISTISAITSDQVDAIVAKRPLLKDFVANLRKNNATEQNDGGMVALNGSIETNLGLFRAYTALYVYNNPNITHDQQILVNTQKPDLSGYRLQVYCFTNTTDWDKFESIQSAVLEHLAAAVADFGLALNTSADVTVQMASEAPKNNA